jgi:hypothetical protein
MPTNPQTILFLVVFTIATVFLNLDLLHFQPLALWAKLLPPVLIAIGGFGAVRDIRALRFAGWLGIFLFLLVALMASFPSEDYLLGGPDTDPAELPRTVSSANTFVRVAVGLAITALLFWRYRRLQCFTKGK